MKRLLLISVLLLGLLAIGAPAFAQENLLADVAAERAKYGSVPSDPELCAILNAVAWKRRDDGWGLSTKPGGTRCRAPQGIDVAHDILQHRPTNKLFDVFVAAGERAEPTWTEVAHHDDPGRPWLAPIAPSDGQTEPPPPVDPPATELGPMLLRIIQLLEDLKSQMGAVHNDTWLTVEELQKLRQAQEAQTVALKAAIEELKAQVSRGVKIRF